MHEEILDAISTKIEDLNTENYNWLTIDSDGTIFIFYKKPLIDIRLDEWVQQDNQPKPKNIGNLYFTTICLFVDPLDLEKYLNNNFSTLIFLIKDLRNYID